MAANEQGKFWEMHDKLFANQQNLDARRPREVRQGDRPRHGQVQGRAGQPQVRRPDRGGHQAGLFARRTGHACRFVNGHFINGAQPFDAFKKIADEELAKGAATKGKKKVAAAIK